MSVVSKESIQVMAQSIGLSNLSPDVLPDLANDIEYRVREIMQVFFLIYFIFHLLPFYNVNPKHPLTGYLCVFVALFGRLIGCLD